MKNINLIEKDFLKPLLKNNGFRKKKALWNRERGNIVDIIQIDQLRGSLEENERFLINVSLATPKILQTIWDEDLNDFQDDADALLRLRLNDFYDSSFSEEINRGFIDLRSDNLLNIGGEVVKVIERKVLPYFDDIIDYEALMSCFDEADNSRHKNYPLAQINYALLKHRLGYNNEANVILESLKTGKNKAWQTKAGDILNRIVGN